MLQPKGKKPGKKEEREEETNGGVGGRLEG
jgi:hypothetical protein